MEKGFKTIEELVELLESRNVKTDSSTAGILRRESYYAIVNGYKGPFLDRDAMQSSADDIYKDGTTFRKLYDLFLFDRHLRQVALSSLIAAESVLKNAAVYSFCARHPKPDAYLERSNYVSAKDMLVPKTYTGNKAEEHSRNLAILMKILNGKLTPSRKTRPFIRHYLESYGNVPLWVLQNDLTFGNIAHFYQLQKRGVQNDACKIVGQIANRKKRLNPHDLLRLFDVLVDFRNICAHDERLYCAEIKGTRCADMFLMLDRVLPKEDTDDLLEALNGLIGQFQGRIERSILLHVVTDMGIRVAQKQPNSQQPQASQPPQPSLPD